MSGENDAAFMTAVKTFEMRPPADDQRGVEGRSRPGQCPAASCGRRALLRVRGRLFHSLRSLPRSWPGESRPAAAAAGILAMGKGRVEMPVLVQIMPDSKVLADATNDAMWAKIAALHRQDAALDPGA